MVLSWHLLPAQDVPHNWGLFIPMSSLSPWEFWGSVTQPLARPRPGCSCGEQQALWCCEGKCRLVGLSHTPEGRRCCPAGAVSVQLEKYEPFPGLHYYSAPIAIKAEVLSQDQKALSWPEPPGAGWLCPDVPSSPQHPPQAGISLVLKGWWINSLPFLHLHLTEKSWRQKNPAETTLNMYYLGECKRERFMAAV